MGIFLLIPSPKILFRSPFQGTMAQDMTEKELLKMELDQLKKEVKNERQMVSKTGKEIKEYIESMAGEDPLLKGVPEDKNPFKEKGGCTIS
ncbi:guanine nucleotide-binding protein G(I)/G(S)/G(O) subunit gamma-T2 [Ammospiza maritima maritima]